MIGTLWWFYYEKRPEDDFFIQCLDSFNFLCAFQVSVLFGVVFSIIKNNYYQGQ